jgi:hypothetical protein
LMCFRANTCTKESASNEKYAPKHNTEIAPTVHGRHV